MALRVAGAGVGAAAAALVGVVALVGAGPVGAATTTLFPSTNAPGPYSVTVPAGICFVTVSADGGPGGTSPGVSPVSVGSAQSGNPGSGVHAAQVVSGGAGASVGARCRGEPWGRSHGGCWGYGRESERQRGRHGWVRRRRGRRRGRGGWWRWGWRVGRRDGGRAPRRGGGRWRRRGRASAGRLGWCGVAGQLRARRAPTAAWVPKVRLPPRPGGVRRTARAATAAPTPPPSIAGVAEAVGCSQEGPAT